MMTQVITQRCIVCDNTSAKKLFSKKSALDEYFTLHACTKCGLQFIYPLPAEDEIAKYYTSNYFTRRTERGYDNYFSAKMQQEIERVITLNLNDLDHFSYERTLTTERSCLDIGCAAGYFVCYMRKKGWHSQGIDISEACVNFAQKHLQLQVTKRNYLQSTYPKKFDLITLWATLEHLHHPEQTISKIYSDLKPGGRLYLSTCRTGTMNFMKFFGEKWRYYNFPEHLFFFSSKNLQLLLQKKGFHIKKVFYYGSGLGKPATKIRKIADFMAKHCQMGDMMVIAAEKRE